MDVTASSCLAEAGDDSVTIGHGTSPITITMDPDTGLPATATTLESDPLRRDVELVVSYQDWAETESGISFLATVVITYDGEPVHQETRTVSTDVEIDASMFEVPEGVEPAFDATLAERGDLSHQYLQSFAAGGSPRDGLQLGVEATESMPGVFHVTGGTHHTLAVLQDDGVVLIEAPLDETRSAVVEAWLETVAPGQPVTHVIQSHHHSDHEVLAESLAISREDGDAYGVARAHWGMFDNEWYQGETDAALRFADLAVAGFTPLDAPFDLGWARFAQADSLQRLGRFEEAKAALNTAVRAFADAGDLSALVLFFEQYAALAIKLDQRRRAARLAGAAQRLQERTGMRLSEAQGWRNVNRATLAALGGIDESVEAELQAGHMMETSAAVAFALDG